jgi:hypothetical protein
MFAEDIAEHDWVEQQFPQAQELEARRRLAAAFLSLVPY